MPLRQENLILWVLLSLLGTDGSGAGFGVLGLIDHTHSPATQPFQDAIMRNRLANHGEETWKSILVRTPTQVNAKGLLRKIHPPQEILEAGGGAQAEGETYGPVLRVSGAPGSSGEWLPACMYVRLILDKRRWVSIWLRRNGFICVFSWLFTSSCGVARTPKLMRTPHR